MKAHRREFLIASTVLSISGIAGGMARSFGDPPEKSADPGAKLTDAKKPEAEAEVSAPEDLMREHGVLNRILLIYDEGVRRLRAKEDLPPANFSKTTTANWKRISSSLSSRNAIKWYHSSKRSARNTRPAER